MKDFAEGDIVICVTSQAGTIAQIAGKDVWVLLQNGDIWVGLTHDIRFPQNQEDLDACPLNIERLAKARSVRLD